MNRDRLVSTAVLRERREQLRGEIDVPEVKKTFPERVQPAFTRYLGPSSIYSICPCEEAIARAAADRLEAHRAPVPVWLPAFDPPRAAGALSAGGDSDDDDFHGDDGLL